MQRRLNKTLIVNNVYLRIGDMICRERFRNGLEGGAHAGGHLWALRLHHLTPTSSSSLQNKNKSYQSLEEIPIPRRRRSFINQINNRQY
jgi:hypothetical protein